MRKDRRVCYIVKDDYTPDYPTIYGVFLSQEGADKCLENLENPDNEYGKNMNENDTIEVDMEDLYD